MKTPIQTILDTQSKKGHVFFLLIDPDKAESHPLLLEPPEQAPDIVLVGGSGELCNSMDNTISLIRSKLDAPIFIFPGDASQVSARADGLLFMTLLSGRNTRFLVEEQVRAAQYVWKSQIPTVATAYILINSGGKTTVVRESGTVPLPADDHDLILSHCLAAKYMGMELLYLEGGSGAGKPIAPDLVELIAKATNLPVIVGGGIRTAQQARDTISAGATGFVVGNLFENPANRGVYQDILRLVR